MTSAHITEPRALCLRSAFGRLLPFARGHHGSLAAGHEWPLAANFGPKLHPGPTSLNDVSNVGLTRSQGY